MSRFFELFGVCSFGGDPYGISLVTLCFSIRIFVGLFLLCNVCPILVVVILVLFRSL